MFRRVLRFADVYAEPGYASDQSVPALLAQCAQIAEDVPHAREVAVAGQQGAAVVEVVDPFVVGPARRPGAQVRSVVQRRPHLGNQPPESCLAGTLTCSGCPESVPVLRHDPPLANAPIRTDSGSFSTFTGPKVPIPIALHSLPLVDATGGKKA